jgi:hypothetical protein
MFKVHSRLRLSESICFQYRIGCDYIYKVRIAPIKTQTCFTNR